MKNGLTELIFILDRSGSMSGLEQDTIGGFNSLIEKQKGESGDAIITTVLFDGDYELLHDRIDLKDVKPITGRDYFVRGTTALLDAIGRSIDKTINVQKNASEDDRAENVMFIITTDGMENASREYRLDKVKAMIEEQKEKYGWEFLFIGANIDAVETAGSYGISPDHAVNYSADSHGVKAKYMAMGKAISYTRKSMPISSNWKDDLESDDRDKTKKPDPVKSNVKNEKKKDKKSKSGTILSRLMKRGR